MRTDQGEGLTADGRETGEDGRRCLVCVKDEADDLTAMAWWEANGWRRMPVVDWWGTNMGERRRLGYVKGKAVDLMAMVSWEATGGGEQLELDRWATGGGPVEVAWLRWTGRGSCFSFFDRQCSL